MSSSTDIRTRSLHSPVPAAQYLFTRIRQLGIRSVHGVPGDFNLTALDYIPKCGLKWVGSVNELNAAYAADGYARFSPPSSSSSSGSRAPGISALITTFGVGELSALNGVAGAYSEHVPLIHIVGCPSTVSQRNGMMLHHTLGNGDFNVFSQMGGNVAVDVARLNRPSEIAEQIDAAIRECWVRSRPVYLLLPTDMVDKQVEGKRLEQPIDLEEKCQDEEREDYVVDVILRSLYEAKNPVVLVDACAIRHRVLNEIKQLVHKTKLPVFVTPMGKGGVDETCPQYGGVYAGTGSRPEVKERVEDAADLVLSVGSIKSDFNTAGFSYKTSVLKTVDLHSDSCKVRYSEYPGVGMKGVLKKLGERVDVGRLGKVEPGPEVASFDQKRDGDEREKGVITHEYLWPRVGGYLREKDIVVTETGTANFGIWETKFPKDVMGVTQILWGSIGWSVGAASGVAMAAKDAGEGERRTILFVGDGSFQLTAQEVTTMIRHKLRVTIFLIYNEGFTIERFIHGMDAEYNDVVRWKYTEIPEVFGGSKETVRKFVVKTRDELEKLLTDKEFNDSDKLQFVELWMPKEDAPRVLKLTAEESAKTNAQLE
ncbi:thiamine diphosphate-binding protein [Cladorrhinum sp. PSN332]|nr:thiamine diphosphate-binding protein [Cladorrhinum sp. PSN332]